MQQEQKLRIISNTFSTLVLAHKPLVVPGIALFIVLGVITETIRTASTLGVGEWIATALGILVGSLISYLSALRSRVVFDAGRGCVTWQHFGWPGRGRGSCPLDQVTEVQVLDDSSGAQRLALSTPGGVVPLTRYFSGIDPHNQNAAAIREWLSRAQSDPPAA